MKLGAMLADAAMRHPDREALVCGERRISFGELDLTANRLANAYLGRGQKIGDRIVMYLPNSAELIEAMVGAAKSGGVIVPISTRLAPPEADYIITDCEPWAIFFAPEFRETVHAAAEKVGNPLLVCFGDAENCEISFNDLRVDNVTPPPPLPTKPDSLMIGYTSGTTGRPKGAVSTHSSLVMIGGFMNHKEWGMNETDRIIATTPMAHRTGLGRIANSVCLGCAVVVMPKFDPVSCVDTIEKERITAIGLVPTIARMLMPEIEKRPEACKTLRMMVATGEAFPVEVKQRLGRALPHLGLYSFYAQTESGFITCLRPEEQKSHAASCGRAVPGVEIRIVDAHRNDLPQGEAGEILMRCGPPGLMTMTEYWKKPEETAKAFHDDWLVTGDVGRLDQDGYLYFVDRAKDMIVSGGLNIYSREVEDAIETHAAVNEAAVVPIPDPEFGEAVCAFVTFHPGKSAEEADIIEHCRTLIASYKKPKRVLPIDNLPRNSNGKILKADLRELAAKESEMA